MNDDCRALLGRAARSYLEARPWERLTAKDYLGIRDAATGLEGWASVLGADREEWGLAVYLGREGRSVLERLLRGDLDEDESVRLTDLVALAVADPAEAERLRSSVLLDVRVEVAGRSVIPTVFRVAPGDGTKALRDREALFLARALLGLASTHAHGLEAADSKDAHGARLVLELEGEGERVNVASRRESEALALGADLEHELHVRARTKRLLVGLAGRRLILLEPKEGVLLDEELADDRPGSAARRVLEALAGRASTRRPGRVPRELWAEPDDLAAVLAVALATLGVKVVPKPGMKELARARGD